MLLVGLFQTGISVLNQPIYRPRTKQTRNVDVTLRMTQIIIVYGRQ
jgi:hypothetical protein